VRSSMMLYGMCEIIRDAMQLKLIPTQSS
jgi:hypothetical protein